MIALAGVRLDTIYIYADHAIMFFVLLMLLVLLKEYKKI